ncbi:MAG: caspase family protein [Muribaculaceae bacterium]|nr:caspase family protein [Muribaculaceae bacterium]
MRRSIPVILLAAAATSALWLTAQTAPADIVVTGADDIEAARIDSISQALVDKASERYKHFKFVQYDGIAEEQLYPMALETYTAIRTAFDAPGLSEDNRQRCRNMILDIGDLFSRGAAFYSAAGNQPGMTECATVYADIHLDDAVNAPAPSSNLYAPLLYAAASGAYNTDDYPRAIKYLNGYIETGTVDRREQVSMFLAQACLKNGTPELGVDNLLASVDLYPGNFNLLMLTLQNCLDAGYTERMQQLLDKALLMAPNDERIISAQARIYESESNFAEALPLYLQLYEMKPNSLPVNQHLALCYYNLGAEYHNKSLMETDAKVAKRYERQAEAYFTSAISNLGAIVSNNPTDTKYLHALAVSYACLGMQDKLDPLNMRLEALGLPPVTTNQMPDAIVYDDQQSARTEQSSSAIPDFQTFARAYVEKDLAEWTKRREFEKVEDFEARVSEDNVYKEYQRLCKDAEAAYLRKYASRLRIADLKLQPYDVDNETYLISSAMGPMVISVPLKNKEAENFKASWNSIQLRHPKYYIKDNHVAIASVDFVTPAGKTYKYSSDRAADYDFTDVKVDINSFIAQGQNRNGRQQDKLAADNSRNSTRVIRAKSDVDVNIPVTSRKAENSIALIIANEDYKNVTPVKCALNDGETFAEYCIKTLGIPESRVILRENVTFAEMLSAVNQLRQYVNTMGDDADVIVYYAGHGFPDEGSKDAYLLPVDGDGFSTVTAYPLKQLYSDLSAMGAGNVMVFLDACFSGSTRDGGMLAEARGVALKPKAVNPQGNMFVLSAASDQETALPYTEKNHGLFTYFLLKKIQDTKGNVSLRDLSQYVEENVKKNSLSVNRKLQTPRTSVSGRLAGEWDKKKLRP